MVKAYLRWRYLTGVICDKKVPTQMKSPLNKIVVRLILFSAGSMTKSQQMGCCIEYDCWKRTKAMDIWDGYGIYYSVEHPMNIIYSRPYC